MQSKRVHRLNSLIKEVISEVIKHDVKNPFVNELIAVTRVEVTSDLHHAKVYISVIGTDNTKKETLEALQSASGFIAVKASKKIVIRYFPALTFILDEGVDRQMRIEEILKDIKKEESLRPKSEESEDDEATR